jgi:DNA-directed RNA polymerase subunit RPC12/RpoP
LGEPEGECGKCGATITADEVDWLSVEEDEELKGMATGVCPRCSQKVISMDEEEDLVKVDGEVFAPVTWYRQGEAQGGTASE